MFYYFDPLYLYLVLPALLLALFAQFKVQSTFNRYSQVYSGSRMTGAQADAMKAAASNSAGAMSGFMGMGMGMASKAGGVDVQQLYQMGAQQQAAGQTQYGGSAQTPGNGAGQPDGQQGTWRCNCGAVNELAWKFCTNCGSPRPAQGWICTCGARNTGKFCTECGKPRPV